MGFTAARFPERKKQAGLKCDCVIFRMCMTPCAHLPAVSGNGASSVAE